MRIPDDLIPLVRELAERHLGDLAAAELLLGYHRAPSHRDRIEAQRRLRDAQRLDAIVNPRRSAA